jgi:hypothetical protein
MVVLKKVFKVFNEFTFYLNPYQLFNLAWVQWKGGHNEWGRTARNLIARQSIGQHFWQEINCSNPVNPGSTGIEQLTLLSSATYKLKKSIFYL